MNVIERLRALEQAATPGPWTWVEPHSVIHDVETEVAPRVEVPVAAIEGLFRMRHANGELIAAMRNAFPALLDVVEAAQAYRTAITSIHHIPLEVDLSEAIDLERDGLFDALDKLP